MLMSGSPQNQPNLVKIMKLRRNLPAELLVRHSAQLLSVLLTQTSAENDLVGLSVTSTWRGYDEALSEPFSVLARICAGQNDIDAGCSLERPAALLSVQVLQEF